MTQNTQLDNLLHAIKNGEHELTTDLPVYGGDEPTDTAEVWSWDQDRLLVGSCVDDLKIVTRAEWNEVA